MVSIVIRAYNESKQLEVLFDHLAAMQIDDQIEYIVVDNESSDSTKTVARKFGAKVVNLEQSAFTYPKSLNIGVTAAHGELVVCLVAHAYPEGSRWLASGLRHFKDPEVAGVFSFTKPHYHAPFWDQLGWLVFWWSYIRGPIRIKSARPGRGVFGATNIVLRKSVWEQHHFDESYASGGEDNEWAQWALDHRLLIIRDPAFTVRHSHFLKSFKQFRAMLKFWSATKAPRSFNREELAFRDREKS